MASNERNNRETEKEIQLSTKSQKPKQGIIEKESKIAKQFIKYLTSAGTALPSKILKVTKDVVNFYLNAIF